MSRQKDWLLEVTNVILIFAEIAFVFALIGVVIGVIGMCTFAHGKVLADLAAAAAPNGTYWAVIAVLVLVWVMLSLSMLFVRQLRAIVGTVDDDPRVRFAPNDGVGDRGGDIRIVDRVRSVGAEIVGTAADIRAARSASVEVAPQPSVVARVVA